MEKLKRRKIEREREREERERERVNNLKHIYLSYNKTFYLIFNSFISKEFLQRQKETEYHKEWEKQEDSVSLKIFHFILT